MLLLRQRRKYRQSIEIPIVIEGIDITSLHRHPIHRSPGQVLEARESGHKEKVVKPALLKDREFILLHLIGDGGAGKHACVV